MKKYSVYLETETEKHDLLRAILERVWYSPEIDALAPGEAWAAWKAGRLTMGQLARWQERHGVYFSPAGEVLP